MLPVLFEVLIPGLSHLDIADGVRLTHTYPLDGKLLQHLWVLIDRWLWKHDAFNCWYPLTIVKNIAWLVDHELVFDLYASLLTLVFVG
jgi:hypothetical protein